jgi:ABC-type transport system substrate-binding protein
MSLLRTAVLAAALATSLLTAACGTPAQPAAVPESAAPSPASSSAPASNIRQPESNDLVTENSHEGARAFLFHYFDLTAYALQTGDTKVLLGHLDRAAAEAERAGRIATVYEEGGWILGGQPKVKNVLITSPEGAGGAVSALIPVNPGEYTAFGADGKVLEHRPFSPDGTIYTASVKYADGAWKITSLEETPGAELPE